jgi:hypothetical protein
MEIPSFGFPAVNCTKMRRHDFGTELAGSECEPYDFGGKERRGL